MRREFPNNFAKPPQPAGESKDLDSEEYIDKSDAKFRKILSEEQYNLWQFFLNPRTMKPIH